MEPLVMEKAELDFELQVCMVHDGPFGKMIKHPLVNEIFYHPEMNSHYNKVLAAKKEALDRAYNDKEWSHYIFLHERPWRAEKLAQVATHIPGNDYWPLVAQTWMDSENIWQNKKLWQRLLTMSHGNREKMMSAKELRIFKGLQKAKTVTLYRGYAPKGDRWGFSWSTDKAKAEWFAKRFSAKNPKVETQMVHTDNIIAYLDGRSEKEVIWIP